MFASCSKDDDCSTDDWAGVYSGTLNCGGSSDPALVTIIKVDDNTISVDGDNVEVDGCSVSRTVDFFWTYHYQVRP